MHPQNNRWDLCKCLSTAASIPATLVSLGWVIWLVASTWLRNTYTIGSDLKSEKTDLDSYDPGF